MFKYNVTLTTTKKSQKKDKPSKKFLNNTYGIAESSAGLVGFYDISTIVSYLMPNLL